MNLYFNLSRFEKLMDENRLRELNKKSRADPIIIAPAHGKIDQTVLKKVLEAINNNLTPETFPSSQHQTPAAKKPAAQAADSAKQPPKAETSKQAPNHPKDSKDQGQEKTAQKPLKKGDIQKMLKSFLKIAQQLMRLSLSLKVLKKLQPKIEKQVAQAVQKKSPSAPTWKFSSDLLQFASLKVIEEVNEAVGRWTTQKISERVLVDQVVEAYLSVMFGAPPTEAQVLADYPAGIMLQAIQSHLPSDKFELLKKLVLQQIREHSQNSEALETLQREVMSKYAKEIEEFQQVLQSELAGKLASKLKARSGQPQERVLGGDEALVEGLLADGELDLASLLADAQEDAGQYDPYPEVD